MASFQHWDGSPNPLRTFWMTRLRKLRAARVVKNNHGLIWLRGGSFEMLVRSQQWRELAVKQRDSKRRLREQSLVFSKLNDNFLP
jgi:hypothetical protein